MQILPKLTTITLILALMVNSIHAEDADDTCQNYEDCAYMQGSHAAHWSIYIPIGAFVVAAIFLGVSDSDHSEYFSHMRSDALGPAEGSVGYSGIHGSKPRHHDSSDPSSFYKGSGSSSNHQHFQAHH